MREAITPLPFKAVVQPGLDDSKNLFQSVLDHAKDAFVLVDDRGRVRYWNSAAELMFGFTAADIHGKDMHDYITPLRYRERAKESFREYQRRGPGRLIDRTVEIEACRSDGKEIVVDLSLASIAINGRRWTYAFIRDVTDRREHMEQLRIVAHTDELTGLSNRRELVLLMEKYRHDALHLLLFDLDNFKEINDTHGHLAGDAALQAVAALVTRVCRSAIGHCRLGGDEFAVLWVDQEHDRVRQEAETLCWSVRNVEAPASLQISGGIACSRDHGPYRYRILEAADRSLYEVKRAGGGGIRFHLTNAGS